MKFLVVFEDIWHNKESAVIDQGNIGTYIKDFAKLNQFYFINDCEPDWEKLDSANPYDVGTFGVGFYDIEVYNDKENDDYAGRFMIFEVGIYD